MILFQNHVPGLIYDSIFRHFSHKNSTACTDRIPAAPLTDVLQHFRCHFPRCTLSRYMPACIINDVVLIPL